MPFFSCTVEQDISPAIRLDRYIAGHLKILTRSQIQARNLEALLDGKPVKISRLVKGGERLELSWREAETLSLIPEDIPLDVIYEDSRVIVVNKAQGMVVHPGAGNRQGTLANALFYRSVVNGRTEKNRCEGQPGPAGIRPGIVHRLDKDTSGVIIAAWDEEALAFLSGQFKERRVKKTYAAFVSGCPRESRGIIEKKIARSRRDRKTFTVSDTEGRPSLTRYKVIRSWKNCSLLLLRPKTGRTHQIRVHLKYLGHPIIGDTLYGREDARFKKSSLMLHARSLSLILPGRETPETFRAPFPARFREMIRIL